MASLASRLVEVVGALGATDTSVLVAGLCRGAVELLGGRGSGYCVLDGDQVEVVAVWQLPQSLVGERFPLAGSALGALVEEGRRSRLDDSVVYSALNDQVFGDRGGISAVARTEAAGRVTGGLYIALEEGRTLDQEQLEVLELLSAHAGVALHDAARFAEAERQRQQTEAVLQATVDGLAVVDARGTVTTWNRAMESLSGTPRAEAVGRPLPFDAPPPGGSLEVEWGGRWLQVHTTAVRGGDEAVVDVRDVTAQRELEASKDLFLATAGHELRTPLTVLIGFGETLLHRWDDLDEARRRELVETMVSRSGRMADLVEQLMQGSQAGTAGVTVRLRPFDLAAEVRRVVTGVAGSAPAHPPRVDAATPVVALGDAAKVEPVVGQLLENAVKYSPGGGAVDVTVTSEGGAAVLRVADRGVGMAPEDLDRVFDRFVRGAAASTGAHPGGVGLGLWIVRRYVEAQGGTVSASLREGGGTVVEVRLPLAPADAS
jgi:NtrC-family two-component system sensor histidine kinase KinB